MQRTDYTKKKDKMIMFKPIPLHLTYEYTISILMLTNFKTFSWFLCWIKRKGRKMFRFFEDAGILEQRQKCRRFWDILFFWLNVTRFLHLNKEFKVNLQNYIYIYIYIYKGFETGNVNFVTTFNFSYTLC